jgi:uncharacterized protein (DUF433 family)
MTRYALNLPQDLKQEAERLARLQGVSLNQFILWSVAEKVGELSQGLDDPNFPGITYRRGASGIPTPVLRGSGLRIQTIITAGQDWGWSEEQLTDQFDLPAHAVKEAFSFYQIHRQEIEVALQAEKILLDQHD